MGGGAGAAVRLPRVSIRLRGTAVVGSGFGRGQVWPVRSWPFRPGFGVVGCFGVVSGDGPWPLGSLAQMGSLAPGAHLQRRNFCFRKYRCIRFLKRPLE